MFLFEFHVFLLLLLLFFFPSLVCALKFYFAMFFSPPYFPFLSVRVSCFLFSVCDVLLSCSVVFSPFLGMFLSQICQ